MVTGQFGVVLTKSQPNVYNRPIMKPKNNDKSSTSKYGNVVAFRNSLAALSSEDHVFDMGILKTNSMNKGKGEDNRDADSEVEEVNNETVTPLKQPMSQRKTRLFAMLILVDNVVQKFVRLCLLFLY
ncbi:hypothetical protein Tco_0426310, partial [Tanacetum coccineum]